MGCESSWDKWDSGSQLTPSSTPHRMIAACMWALVARGQRGKLWFISRNKLGEQCNPPSVSLTPPDPDPRFRRAQASSDPTASCWSNSSSPSTASYLSCSSYSTHASTLRPKPFTWSSSLPSPSPVSVRPRSPGDLSALEEVKRSSAGSFFQWAGWIQVYGTLSAIPRQGMANASGAERRTVYRSRLTRLLESALLRTLLLVVIPCLYIILLLVPAIRAGTWTSALLLLGTH